MGKDIYTEILLDIQKQVGNVASMANVHTEQLSSIEEQVKYTNGRVTKTEADVRILQQERDVRKGRSAVIGAITGVITAIAIGVIIALIKGLIHIG